MAPIVQLYNTFRNRWCGAYYASKGIRTIPTVSWGNENTFDFCFEGIEKYSTIAVSTYMVSVHGQRKDQKDFFLKGYNEMLRQLEPERIICYNEPFPEMGGNIVYVNYELSSWRHMNNDFSTPAPPSKYFKYISGMEQWPEDCNITNKTGFVLAKGMGSSGGGKWQPTNEDGEQLLGEPGEKKTSGYKETEIGEDGRATYQTHNTDHGNPIEHSNPHGHEISWNEHGQPEFGPAINDFGAKAFYCYRKGAFDMEWTPEYLYKTATQEKLERNRFKTISDFKWCIKHGGEVGFFYDSKYYAVFPKLKLGKDVKERILITQTNINTPEKTQKWYDTADEALEYKIGDVRLRDIITSVEVFDRTI